MTGAAPVRLVLVRHGHPAGAWGRDADPGLDEVGRAQATATAEALAAMRPQPLLVSPLRRTRETAAPLEARWSVPGAVDAAVGELRAPPDPRPDHRAWLRDVMASRWSDLDDELRAFRDRVLRRLLAVDTDTVVFTHFLAINVAVGAATADDRVVSWSPAHCSRTVVEVVDGGLRLVERGEAGSDAVRLG